MCDIHADLLLVPASMEGERAAYPEITTACYECFVSQCAEVDVVRTYGFTNRPREEGEPRWITAERERLERDMSAAQSEYERQLEEQREAHDWYANPHSADTSPWSSPRDERSASPIADGP